MGVNAAWHKLIIITLALYELSTFYTTISCETLFLFTTACSLNEFKPGVKTYSDLLYYDCSRWLGNLTDLSLFLFADLSVPW